MPSPVEQIKERLDLVEVIQSYVKLHKAGSNFKANCPFHNEKTPSFFVSPSKNFWHCFGCGASGDIFEFIKKIEAVEFPEALQILARRAGVELKKEDPRTTGERTRLFKVTEEAARFFSHNLKSRPDVLNYLKERGLEPETISSFRLGYALGPPENGWRSLLNFLKTRGFKETDIEKAGLIIKSANGAEQAASYYDRFRNRIIFPLFDATGRIVGFSGRIFNSSAGLPAETSAKAGVSAQAGTSAPAKYVNTPQTLIYDKSRVLYGFNFAKNAIRQNDFCLLVEGQMDLIMCHQSGIVNSAAVSGTALSSFHLTSVGRLTKNLITAFDMDDAGQMATKRGVDMALENGFEVKIVSLASGKDPADAAKENPEELKNAIKNSKHIIDFYLASCKKKISDERKLKQEVGKSVLPYAALIQSPMEQSHWVAKIARFLNMREEPVWDEVKKLKKSPAKTLRPNQETSQKNYAPFSEKKKRKDILEERLLGIAAWKGKEAAELLKDETGCFSEKNRLVLKALSGASSEKEGVRAMDVMEKGEKERILKLALEAELLYSDIAEPGKEINSLLSELKREALKAQLESLALSIKQLEESGDKEKLKVQLSAFQEISRELMKNRNQPPAAGH